MQKGWPRRLMRGLVLLMVFSASSAEAVELSGPEEEVRLDLHGFVSQGFILSTSNNFLARSKRGSFEFTEVGLNLTASLGERLRSGLQLFAFDLGPAGDYKATLDWFYLDYRWKDWLGVRAGRVKLPFGLYNDTADIDATRSVILLPQSVYPALNRNFLLAQTGLELYGYLKIPGAGAVDYRLYGGTIFLDVRPQPGSPFQLLELTIPYVVGGRVMWEPPVEGLRVGGSLQALRLESELLSPADPMPIDVDIPAVLWVASAEYTVHDLLVAAEYSRWHTEVDSSNPMVFPERSTVSERAYALAAYRVNAWLQPSLYYSLLFPDVDDRFGRAQHQHDFAASVRFDVSTYWIIKLEGHFLHGTAGLSSSLNDGIPLPMLERDWLLLLAKTTAYF